MPGSTEQERKAGAQAWRPIGLNMSYILDALKKSEEARGPRKTRRLLDVPIKSSQPPKRSLRRPYLIAFIVFLSAGFLVFRLHPRQWGANMGSAGSRIAGGPIPENRRQEAPATQPGPIPQAVEKQGDAQSQPDAALNPPASAKADLNVSDGEKKGERSTTENAGQTANPVEPSTIASGSPPVSGTQNTGETARDQAAETKISPKDSGAAQVAKTEPVPAHPAPVKHPSATPGASRTATAEVKGPDSPKLPQSPRAIETKQGLKTAKSETAVKKPPGPVEKPFQAGAGGEIVADLKELAKPAERREPRLNELAPQVRDAIPAISVSMLVYSRKPENRWININGSKRSEGQEIASGLKLEEITPDGAIFSYQGQRFYKSVVGD